MEWKCCKDCFIKDNADCMIEEADNFKNCVRCRVERINSQIVNELYKLISEHLKDAEIIIKTKSISVK